MASVLKVDKLDPQSGTALEIGTSGDTISVPSGATLDISASTLTPPATMPASSGVNFTALNASNLGSGTVPAARLSGIGKVLQVVQGTLGGVVSTTSGTWSDTGLGAAITCSATSSKVLVSVSLISCYINTANKSANSTLFRDIGGGGYSNLAPTGTSAFYQYFATSYDPASGQTQGHNWEILDSPSSTSEINYKVYFEVDTVSTLNVNQNDVTSYIILQEIGA